MTLRAAEHALPATLAGGAGYRLLRDTIRLLLRVGWGLQVSGLERLPRPPYLLIPNHSSEIDPIVLSAALPIRPTYLTARDLERFPVLFRMIKWFDPLLVRRGGVADVGSIKACIERLGRGDVLVIFPEGRVVQEASLGPFHRGPAFVALRAGVPVVPVALLGVSRMWPLGARIPRRARIGVRIGEMIPHVAGLDADALTGRMREALEGLIQEGDGSVV